MTYVLDQAAGVVFRIVEQAVDFRLEPVARPDPGEASAGWWIGAPDWRSCQSGGN